MQATAKYDRTDDRNVVLTVPVGEALALRDLLGRQTGVTFKALWALNELLPRPVSDDTNQPKGQ